MPNSRAILLYLYSTANIMACIWGVLALIAFFATRNIYWLLAVPVLYGSGYFITPKNHISENAWVSGNDLSPRDLKIQLEALIKNIHHRLSPSELEKVNAIKDNVLILLPRLEEMDAGDYDLHVVKQTVTDYLPAMLTTYLELPPIFARVHKMRNGKTAQEILIEQLTLLDEQIAQIVISANSKDAEALIAQGEFLKSKFANDGDWL
jgi:hypothetical protein